ncbi:MAG TPA: protein-glutamate O-methyltransferase CheR [Treponemataceae bacterium]|nr:protein-glutamate O-methyltransferase CheR [Treponemataceae bacterium]
MFDIKKGRINEIRDLVYREFGIHISDNKIGSIEPKINKLLMNEKYRTAEDFFSELETGNPKTKELLIKYITTNHTYFFREAEHFTHLLEDIKKTNKTNITIWCAASSTGEEPYSIAMTLLDEGIKDFKILASDLDRCVLEEFNEGIYNENRFIKTSKYQKIKYFEKLSEGVYKIRSELRKHICIKRLNLMDNLYFTQPFDYIFCRNVFIYFDDTSRQRTLETLARSLVSGGKLYIGHTETLFTFPSSLRREANSVYRKF